MHFVTLCSFRHEITIFCNEFAVCLSLVLKMKKKSRQHRAPTQQRPSSPIKPSRNRETLTYAEAQRMVEIELDGRVHRLSIYDKLDVICDDDPTAQEIMECNSNKENSEKPVQVLVRSVRLKNNQQKKNAALSAVHGTPPQASALPEPKIRSVEYNLPAVPRRPSTYYNYEEKTSEELDEEVEYDMDEEDYAWLDLVNEKRKTEGFSQVSQNVFEFLMDRFEKESFFESQGNGDPHTLIDEDAVCCICMDGECQNSNVILFCDMCNLAVHQECYGVPYIPEGQWLCRHCLQSPSQPADCVFCPNKGGALKRTDDDRWGHVVCALWVPEVGFSNTVFIEPIDGVANIPPARWKLTCYLCKERGAGACIQCHKANCYTAFHVSCAQKAGLYMKMEPVKEVTDTGSSTFSVKKTAFCGAHTPSGCTRRPLTIYDDPKSKNNQKNEQKSGKRAKVLQKKKSKKAVPEPTAAVPPPTVPSISSKSFNTILNQVSIQKKKLFVERVLTYWMLKRQSRNGVPLIRRLHTTVLSQKTDEPDRGENTCYALKERLKDWHRLRHNLERARLLLELIRKREKLKRDEMKLQQSVLEMQLTPFTIFLRALLEQLKEKDQYKVFTQPVSVKEVPDYLDHIQHPMDFSTMRKRIDAHGYKNLDEFEDDFNLVISNCMKYNAKDTFYHRIGVRMRDSGGTIIRKARRHAEQMGFDFPSGIHLPDAPDVEPLPDVSWDEVDRILNPSSRKDMSLEDQLKELLEKLDLVTAMKSSPSRSKRLKLLKKAISDVRTGMTGVNSQPVCCEEIKAEEEPQLLPPPELLTEEEGDKMLPPKLEPSDSSPLVMNSVSHSEPPTLKPVEPTHDKHPKRVQFNGDGTDTSVPNGHPSNLLLSNKDLGVVATSTITEPSCTINRRTSVLFRKSKSVSPQKTPNLGDAQSECPQLGTKTFLSVVIPRLETLFQSRKRTRSISGDSQADDGESPVKRLDIGQTNGCIVKQKKGHGRAVEPRRRCVSESSISSDTSELCTTSTITLPKCGKVKQTVARRKTLDDKNGLMTCIENERLTRPGKITADHGAQDALCRLPSQRRVHQSQSPPGRASGRRSDSVDVRGDTLPRPLLRQQTQLAMAS
ncbi:bromodomain-containing protein 1-like isoform X2 [Denticeps clupeoides]|uniref:bromodomain-containing protein 1-like isoform X2 n=1 Tax=Denticeps clupeoides TaxID=299321 RepID=UPI0010A41450|nr:bromodomain-containing protein 1-like isoform X2 [Denticeps clupeoides]